MTISSIETEENLVNQAVDALNETKIHDEGKKPLFEEDTNTLFLQIMLKKIPLRNKCQMIKVNLPHSLLKHNDEVCLITGDTNKSDRKAETEPDVLHYRKLLDRLEVTQISKIVTLRQLRTDYKPYADKQKLLAACDVFLVDRKIYECIHNILGKFFYKKRKLPLKINMNSQNLKQQIENALSLKMFYVTGNGNSCCSEVAYLNMPKSEIYANVDEMVRTVSKKIPGGCNNIMGIYLKTARSKAIPIYMSYGNPNDVVLPAGETDDEFTMDELSTKPNVSVKVHKDGKVELFSFKKEMQELKSDCPEKIIKVETEISEMKNKRNESSKKKKRKIFENEVDSSNGFIEKEHVLDEDIFVLDSGKKKNKSNKKKVQNFEVDGSENITCKKSKKKIKKNVLDEDISIEDPESNIAFEETEHTNSTKKPEKEKKNVLEDSSKTSLLTGDLPEKKKKAAIKRKREQSESGSIEKEPFLSFASPKQDTKKIKVDSKKLKIQQPLKNARKKILLQKT